jgi:hypothetical protein
VGALLERALAAASDALYERLPDGQPANRDGTTYAQREADAIGLLAKWALGGGALVPVGQQQRVQQDVQRRNDATQPTHAASLDHDTSHKTRHATSPRCQCMHRRLRSRVNREAGGHVRAHARRPLLAPSGFR